MHETLIAKSDKPIPVLAMFDEDLETVLTAPRDQAMARAQRFKGQAGGLVLVSGEDGSLERVWYGLGKAAQPDAMALRGLSARLPDGDYQLSVSRDLISPDSLALGWALGAYLFDRYKPREDRQRPRLVAPQGCDLQGVLRIASNCVLARQMVDTPAQDMGPLQIETIAREIAEEHRAQIVVTSGAELAEDYPAVHAVGRAADPARGPRIIEITWNGDRADLPLVCLVGKGVVFDSGGLDIKPAAGMRNMKKDMGGSAHALALGRLVMQAGLPVRLKVIVPTVENAISGDAFRPGDVLKTRKGLTVEVGHTDAEGRLILCDALARAGEHEPDLTIDFATLTGAARVALGPQLPPFYTDDDALALAIWEASLAVADPVWRMPLWQGYREAVEAEIADLCNESAAWAQAGSVTAALFLQRFAPATGSWVHFDIFAWNPKGRPGWPAGGEAQALRAVFEMLKGRYA
jgi:leucyl aminopeptidase